MKSLSEDGGLVKEFEKFFYVFLETIRNLDGCSEFGDKIAKWDLSKIFRSWTLATNPMKNGFTLLNHGDLWVNNMLLSLSPDDVLFIDFQMCFYGSPASDLLYFLTTSVCDEIKVSRFDHLVQVYHSELCDALRRLGYKKHVPTLEEVHQDMLEKSSFGKQTTSHMVWLSTQNFHCSMLPTNANPAYCQERRSRRIRYERLTEHPGYGFSEKLLPK